MNNEIKCKNCDCTDVTVTVLHKKATLWKTLKFLCIIALFLITVFYMAEIIEYSEEKINQATTASDFSSMAIVDMPVVDDKITGSTNPTAFAVANSYMAMSLIIFFTVSTVIFALVQFYTESKIETYYICKKCGNTWRKYQGN